MPADPDCKNQAVFGVALSQVPRFIAASLLGYPAGQLLNSPILAKIKKVFGEKRLWVHLFGSTMVGEVADTAVFCLVARTGNTGRAMIFNLMLVGFAYKVGVEAVFLPLAYAIIRFVKKTDPTYVESSAGEQTSYGGWVPYEEGVSKAGGRETAK